MFSTLTYLDNVPSQWPGIPCLNVAFLNSVLKLMVKGQQAPVVDL